MNTLSIGEALKFGWKVTKERFWFLVGLMVIVFLIGNLPQIVGTLFGVKDSWGFSIIAIVAVVLQMVVQLGSLRLILNLVDGKPVKYADLFSESQSFFTYFVASLLVAVMVGVGFILFIIPGVVLAITYKFYSYCIVDKKLGIVESIKMSATLTKGYRWQLFGFLLVAALLNIVGALLLGVGLLITIPTTMVAYAYIYRRLTTFSAEPVAAPVVA